MSNPIRPPKNAILLGKDKWIEHVDLSGQYDLAIDIDPWMKDLWPMWNALETECVSDCCGIDAFNLFPESVADAALKFDRELVCGKLQDLRSLLEALSGDVFVSKRLNNFFARSVFFEVLNHLNEHFCGGRGDA
jgi:hypothetical protein